jgi:hypothetical protein
MEPFDVHITTVREIPEDWFLCQDSQDVEPVLEHFGLEFREFAYAWVDPQQVEQGDYGPVCYVAHHIRLSSPALKIVLKEGKV